MKNELSVVEEFNLGCNGGVYCSLNADTDEKRKLIFNSVNSPTHKLSDAINKEIKVKHIYIETVDMHITDDDGNQTADFKPMARMILIDENGESYSTSSTGVINSMRRIVGMYGDPNNWEKPISIKPKLVVSGKKNYTVIELM